MVSTDVAMIDLSAAIREFDNLKRATMDVVRQIQAAKRELSKITANDGAIHQNNADAMMTDQTEPDRPVPPPQQSISIAGLAPSHTVRAVDNSHRGIPDVKLLKRLAEGESFSSESLVVVESITATDGDWREGFVGRFANLMDVQSYDYTRWKIRHTSPDK
ncbi:hypothetical protein OEA41_009462 [Lepraria neglecta]|uniref:Uncharacterized protein n=1 Tax=Lepraria neglecta TaxID=209136 RepID=A0AAD9Z4X2_9LECA|nr:hypothetical protein OEA41_009462 [Lepraria neglecta]